MHPGDWPTVRAIYEDGIITGMATFETTPPDWEKWDSSHINACRLAARTPDRRVLGWAAISPTSSRSVYAGVGEVSVYIAREARGQGIGKALMQALIGASEQAGLWTLQAAIMADNLASIHLHEVTGFRLVGRREKIGRLNGVWRDTILMERRSLTVGV